MENTVCGHEWNRKEDEERHVQYGVLPEARPQRKCSVRDKPCSDRDRNDLPTLPCTAGEEATHHQQQRDTPAKHDTAKNCVNQGYVRNRIGPKCRNSPGICINEQRKALPRETGSHNQEESKSHDTESDCK